MFPTSCSELENEIKIQYTARIMPEDQNSGGFYVALMRKNNHTKFPIVEEPYDAGETNELEKETQNEVENNGEILAFEQANETEQELLGTKREEGTEIPTDLIETGLNIKSKENGKLSSFKLLQEKDQAKYEPVPLSTWESITNIYGIGPEFPSHLLAVPNGLGKKIYILSETIASILRSDTKKNLNTVYFGTTVFTKNKHPVDNIDFYRLSNNGIKYIYPFMTKNIVRISREEFAYLVKKGQTIFNEELKANLPDTHKKFTELNMGSYCLVFKDEGLEQEELITITKMVNSIVIMVPKEDIAGLRIKYDF